MKLLIADDDPVSIAALRSVIGSPEGWQITEVPDGQAALDTLCDGFRADLCIFDLKMPRLDGMQLLQRIRRDPTLKSIKVVVTSAARDRETILALAKLQISGYLLKPYDVGKTKAVLEPLLPQVANPLLASRNLLTRTLLVVADDAPLTETLKSSANWETHTTTTAEEALQKLRAGMRPDLLLVDLALRGSSGTDLVQQVRADPALEKTRIAVMAADQDRERLQSLAQQRIFGLLPKPCVAAKVRELLAKAEAD